MNLVMIDLKGKHSIQRQVVHKHTYSNIDTQAHRQTSYIYIYTYIYIYYTDDIPLLILHIPAPVALATDFVCAFLRHVNDWQSASIMYCWYKAF